MRRLGESVLLVVAALAGCGRDTAPASGTGTAMGSGDGLERLSKAMTDASAKGSRSTDAELGRAFDELRAFYVSPRRTEDMSADGMKLLELRAFIVAGGVRAVDRVLALLSDREQPVPRAALLGILGQFEDARVVPCFAALPTNSMSEEEIVAAYNACATNASTDALALLDRLPLLSDDAALRDFPGKVRASVEKRLRDAASSR